MDDRRNSEPDPMTQARARLAAAAEGVRRLEVAAQQAFCRLAALAGMMARLSQVGLAAYAGESPLLLAARRMSSFIG